MKELDFVFILVIIDFTHTIFIISKVYRLRIRVYINFIILNQFLLTTKRKNYSIYSSFQQLIKSNF